MTRDRFSVPHKESVCRKRVIYCCVGWHSATVTSIGKFFKSIRL
jgi:hypothetical protein